MNQAQKALNALVVRLLVAHVAAQEDTPDKSNSKPNFSNLILGSAAAGLYPAELM